MVVGGSWCLSQWLLGERQGTFWTGYQSNTGTLKSTFILKGNLQEPVNPTLTFLDSGSWSTQRELTLAQRTNFTEKVFPHSVGYSQGDPRLTRITKKFSWEFKVKVTLKVTQATKLQWPYLAIIVDGLVH